MKLKLCVGPALLASALCGAIAAVEPSAILFENDQVKVVRALEKAHVKGKFHEHKMNRVMIYLQAGKQRFEYQDGRAASVSDWKPGQAVWSEPAGMHAPEVIGDQPFNIVEVELKAPGTGRTVTGDLDPLKVDPRHYSLEFENAQVRVLRVKVEGHGATPLHEHAVNRVTVFLTEQEFRVTDSSGKVDIVKHKAGDAVWGTPIKHTEENLTDRPFEVVAVELK